MSDKKNKNKKKWFLYLILSGLLVKLFSFLFKRKKDIGSNFKNFINEEKEEIKELASGKEGFKKFCCDSGSILKDYFVPYDGNGHKPKILRTKSLAIIAVILVIIKMSVAGYLFFVYPNQAEMSELITKNILELINTDRKNNGLGELANNSILNKAAFDKAQDMTEKGYFAHKSPDGRMSWDFIDRSEYAYLFVGENLAMNFTSAQTAHKALMLSESHKKNILNNKYSDVGLAVLVGVINEKKTNVLVQIFGSANNAKLAMALETGKQMDKKSVEILPVKTIKQEVQIVNSQDKVKQINIIKEETKKAKKIDEIEKTKKADKRGESKEVEEIKKIENQPIQNFVEKNTTEVKAAPVLNIEDKISDADFNKMKANLNQEIKSFDIESDKKIGILAKATKISHYIFFIALAIVTLSLLVNIFVKFRIQHKMLITESVLAIIFIISLVYVKTNFLEYVLEKVFVV